MKTITDIPIRPRSMVDISLTANVDGDNHFSPVKTTSALLGCWKRINFSELAMRNMN